MVIPMIIGQTPIFSKLGTGKCNKVDNTSGSGADKSLIQPINGAWRISIAIFKTLCNEKNTGIWINIGKQPAAS